MDSLYLRYASALLDVALEENKLQEYKEALSELNEYFLVEKDIKTYLESYLVEMDAKILVISKLVEPYKLDNLGHFLCVLIKKHRFHDFSKYEKEFRKIANEKLNILDGLVFSVNPLSKQDIKRIEDSLTNKIGKKVELENKIDPNLIGGVKVLVDDHIYDGSIKGQIDKLGKDLRKGDSL